MKKSLPPLRIDVTAEAEVVLRDNYEGDVEIELDYGNGERSIAPMEVDRVEMDDVSELSEEEVGR